MTKILLSFILCSVLFYSTGQKQAENQTKIFGYSNFSKDYKGLTVAAENYSQKYFVINSNGAKLALIDTLPFDINQFESDISKSNINDKNLILRVLSMIKDEETKKKEIIHLSRSSVDVQNLVNQQKLENFADQ